MGDSERERFRSRVIAAQERQNAALASTLSVSLFRRERLGVFEDYLWVARKRRSEAFALMRLQLNLLQDLLTAQRALGESKQLLAEMPPEEHVAIKREMDFRSVERQVIRDIGDGIAWRMFGYDRTALYLLADRPAVAHVELDGLSAELSAFANAVDSTGGVAILNCITNVLRRGDVTVRPAPDEFEFLEVKTGHKTSVTCPAFFGPAET